MALNFRLENRLAQVAALSLTVKERLRGSAALVRGYTRVRTPAESLRVSPRSQR